MVWIAVALLGGAGALARHLIDAEVTRRSAGGFPLGTLAVNLSGAAVLGMLAGLAIRGDTLLLGGTALLGSYTTFSTWMLESHRLGEDGQARAMGLNLALSLALGVAAVAAGRAIGGAL